MSTQILENLRYTEDHEWASAEGNIATIGVTDYAQSALGDIVFLELPEVGRKLTKGATFGVLESIKSVSDLYSPLTGEIVEVNSPLADAPEEVNKDAYGAWMIKIKMTDMSEFNSLMDSKSYLSHCENSH